MTIDTKELRRLAQAAMTGPDGVSLNWLKLLQDFQKEANPAAINELLDRLEAAEKERDWNAERLEDAIEECTALRAKIDAMENQEPVGKFIQHPSHGLWEQDGYSDNPDAKPLYLAPGAQTQGERK